MNGTKLVVFLIGTLLVIAAGWMLFVETGMSRWVPIGVAAAGLLLFIGLAVMGLSESMPSRRNRDVIIEDERHRHH